MTAGPLELLIFQGTPFCNINCSYCYLPNRGSTAKISLNTVEAAFRRVFASGLVQKDFAVVWHAGEPLVMPISFYESAIEAGARLNTTCVKISHTIQTNATLITPLWCEFFKRKQVSVGVSIDGPAFIHDRQRPDRLGRGTHERVMAGIQLLKAHQVPFYVIAVVSDTTLDHAKDFFDFFLDLGVGRLCLNIEEAEGVHLRSSLSTDESSTRFERFFSELYDLYEPYRETISIREFDQLERLIFKGSLQGRPSQQTIPYRIISVDTNGGFSTFSPELLGMKAVDGGDFLMGNVHRDDFTEALVSCNFERMYSSIIKGLIACKQTCDYYDVCGGGTPSNKYSENGSFESTQTRHCLLRNQRLFEVVLGKNLT